MNTTFSGIRNQFLGLGKRILGYTEQYCKDLDIFAQNYSHGCPIDF
jgi:hypothetical protein